MRRMKGWRDGEDEGMGRMEGWRDGFPLLLSALLLPRPSTSHHPSPHLPKAGPPAPAPQVEQPAVHTHTHALAHACPRARSPAAGAPWTRSGSGAWGRCRGRWQSGSPKTGPWGGAGPCPPPGRTPGLRGGRERRGVAHARASDTTPSVHVYPLHTRVHPHTPTRTLTPHTRVHTPSHECWWLSPSPPRSHRPPLPPPGRSLMFSL